jgi:hypothetical protein
LMAFASAAWARSLPDLDQVQLTVVGGGLAAQFTFYGSADGDPTLTTIMTKEEAQRFRSSVASGTELRAATRVNPNVMVSLAGGREAMAALERCIVTMAGTPADLLPEAPARGLPRRERMYNANDGWFVQAMRMPNNSMICNVSKLARDATALEIFSLPDRSVFALRRANWRFSQQPTNINLRLGAEGAQGAVLSAVQANDMRALYSDVGTFERFLQQLTAVRVFVIQAPGERPIVFDMAGVAEASAALERCQADVARGS